MSPLIKAHNGHTPQLAPFEREILLEILARIREEDFIQAHASVQSDPMVAVSSELERYRRLQWAKELLILFPFQCAGLCQWMWPS